jgi:hypothetical protein
MIHVPLAQVKLIKMFWAKNHPKKMIVFVVLLVVVISATSFRRSGSVRLSVTMVNISLLYSMAQENKENASLASDLVSNVPNVLKVKIKTVSSQLRSMVWQ